MIMKFAHTGLVMGMVAILALPASAEAQRKRSNSTSAPTSSVQGDAMAKLIEDRQAAAQAKAPWHFKTPAIGQFRSPNPSAIIAEEHFALTGMGWKVISKGLTDKKGTFPSYTVFLGITADGALEGVLFPSSSTQIFGPNLPSRLLDEVSSLEIQIADGERASMQLSEVKLAEFDQTYRGKTSKQKIWYKTFTPGGKAWRMLGGLPDESKLTLHHTTSDGPGQMKYRVASREEATIFTIGYLKEMMKAVSDQSASK